MKADGHTVLVVDDEELNREMLSRRLERAGYNVLVAQDGYAALGTVDVEPVDLVLLDIMMPPGIDGIKVLENLRKKRSESELPVIMASALNDSDVIVKALNAGANDYVAKPLDFPVVLARIEAQLRHKRSAPPARPEPEQIEPGATLGGRYELIDLVGEGGFGSVYRARHIELEFDVAVKVLHPNMARDPALLERFRREGISSCRVHHPNAVNIYDFQTTPSGAAYLVMEFLQGNSLAEYLEGNPPLSPERCVQILVPVCEVLAVAHEAGVLHRDIKPENLFLEQINARETVKVLDFGIAELKDIAETRKLTRSGMLVGSPLFMAPERLLGESIDGRSDVFSLGVVLFRMLAGEYPFSCKNLDQRLHMLMRGDTQFQPLDAQVPEGVRRLVSQALSRDPDERPDATRFAEALIAAVEGGQVAMATGVPSRRGAAAADALANDGLTVAAGTPDRPHEKAAPQAAHDPVRRRATVLLVEDNELNREMLVRRLEKRGFDVGVAVDGADALAKARSTVPDLILMDLRLPVMDGWDATRVLKSDPATAAIPVIALTAHAMDGSEKTALEAGCDDFDTKPVALPRLIAKMQRLLDAGRDD